MKEHDEDGIAVTKHGNRVKKQNNPMRAHPKLYDADDETHNSNSKPKQKDRHYHRIIVTIEI